MSEITNKLDALVKGHQAKMKEAIKIEDAAVAAGYPNIAMQYYRVAEYHSSQITALDKIWALVERLGKERDEWQTAALTLEAENARLRAELAIALASVPLHTLYDPANIALVSDAVYDGGER